MILAAATLVAFLAAAYVVLVFIGDANDAAEGPPTPSSFPPGTITASTDAEMDCGEYTWGIDAQLREDATDRFAEEHSCLQAALAAGQPAVLVEHSYTTEGDPIRQQLRVVAADRLELTYDATLDNFGSGTIDTVTCTGLKVDHSAVVPTGCDPSTARGEDP